MNVQLGLWIQFLSSTQERLHDRSTKQDNEVTLEHARKLRQHLNNTDESFETF